MGGRTVLLVLGEPRPHMVSPGFSTAHTVSPLTPQAGRQSNVGCVPVPTTTLKPLRQADGPSASPQPRPSREKRAPAAAARNVASDRHSRGIGLSSLLQNGSPATAEL